MENNHFAVMIAGLVKPGMDGYMKHYLKEMMDESVKDKGCILYNIHQSTDNPLEFMVYMLWESEAAFEKHNQKPEMQEFKKELSKQMFEAQSPKTCWKLLR